MFELRTVDTYIVDTVKAEESFPEFEGCPLSADARRLLMQRCPVMLYADYKDGEQQTIDYEATIREIGLDGRLDGVSLRQPGKIHKRSALLEGQDLEKGWRDSYGNSYASLTLKGINFSNPGAMEHPTASRGVVAYGLQESYVMERVLRASRLLASRGIGTEMIMGLAEPKEYPIPKPDHEPSVEDHDFVNLATYKSFIVRQTWDGLPEDQRTLEKMSELTEKFQDMTFVISLRAADTAYRLDEIIEPDVLETVFEQINQHHLEDGEKPYDITAKYEYGRYVTNFLAPRIGRNFARLHVDLAHGFANGLNISAIGSIVDLDSVHGEPMGLGDQPVTVADRSRDLIHSFVALYATSPMVAHEPGAVLTLENYSLRSVQPVTSYFRAYVDETLRLSSNREAAIVQLGQTLQLLAEGLNEYDKSGELAGRPATALCEVYLDALRQPYRTEMPASNDELGLRQVIEAKLQDGLLHETIKNYIALPEQVDRYARLIVGEYLNELEDPTYDVWSAFQRHDTISDYVSSVVSYDITSVVMEELIGQLDEADLPAYIRSIQDEDVRQLAVGIYVDQSYDHLIEGVAARLQSEPLSYFEPLAPKMQYRRPESVIDGYTTRPLLGLRDQEFMISTEIVPLSAVVHLVSADNISLTVARSLTVTKDGFGMHIKPGDHVEQIITDSFVCDEKVVEVNGETCLDLLFDNEFCGYVLLVKRPPDGSVHYELLIGKAEKIATKPVVELSEAQVVNNNNVSNTIIVASGQAALFDV